MDRGIMLSERFKPNFTVSIGPCGFNRRVILEYLRWPLFPLYKLNVLLALMPED
jgi:hypothetical protein